MKYAKPMGVIGAVTPSTNPGATPVNKAMMAIKGRNAIVIAPSPLGYRTTARVVELMRAELEAIGLPADLVQIIPSPVTKDSTEAMMRACDLVVVTGSQDNVRRALFQRDAGHRRRRGQRAGDDRRDRRSRRRRCEDPRLEDLRQLDLLFSENAVVIVDAVYDQAIAALERAGAYLCTPQEKQRIVERLWVRGKLNRDLIAKDADVLARAFDLPRRQTESSTSL